MDEKTTKAWKLVIPYCYSTADMWRLRQTCKTLASNIKGEIVHKTNLAIIRSRIIEMSIDPDELDTLLIKTNAVLSGSFLVQCIVGDKWKDSDIDVFGQIKQKYILAKRAEILPPTCSRDVRAPIHKLELLPWNYINRPFAATNTEKKKTVLFFPKSSGGFNSEYSGIIGFAYSRKYILPTPDSKIVESDGDSHIVGGTIFNFVGTRINATRYIQKCFDLSFCKNYYDGKKLTIMHPYHVLSRIGKLVRFTNSMNFIHKIPKKVYSRISKYKTRGFHVKRHSEYNGLEELVKFRKYKYEISRELPRNTRFKYKFPEKFDNDNFVKLKLECKSIQIIKIRTIKYRYMIIRFNRVGDIPIYILFNISGKDDINLLKYTINGLKSIMKKFWYFESMNPSIPVEFNYLSEEMNTRICKISTLKAMFVDSD
jgi:hypothetical protein